MFKIILLPFTCLTLTVHAQTHFVKTKAIHYRQLKISQGTDVTDTTYVAYINLEKVISLRKFRIVVREVKGTETSEILIYKEQRLFQKFTIPYSAWTMDNTAFIADINGDKRLDVKFFIFNNGSGLAGSLSTKIYLFNNRDKFKLISFFDFAYEREHDLNGDDNFEIISCNHIFKGNHSYWVYNSYNYINGSLINNSKKFNYPLWTKHLEKTDRVVANIPFKDRMKEFKFKPNELRIE